jgi:hypothetical protein
LQGQGSDTQLISQRLVTCAHPQIQSAKYDAMGRHTETATGAEADHNYCFK